MNTSSHQQYPARKLLKLAVTAIFSLSALAPARMFADRVVLSDGNALTGTLLKLDSDTVTLKAAMAAKPVQIRASSVKSITFPTRDEPKQQIIHTENATLGNNDSLPCKILSMDETHVFVTTAYAGKFNISRSEIRSLQFGIRNEDTVFIGDKDPGQWSNMDGTWERTSPDVNGYVGNGSLAQAINLPENLRIKFTLGWKEGSQPNFVLRFCSEENSAITKQNTYELSFNSAGTQIRRYLNNTQPSVVIANIVTIKPQTYNDNKADIDLQVNRQEGEISLSINSEHIATWPDPFSAPTGNYIIFNNRSKDSRSCIISDIVVTALGDIDLSRYHADKPALTKNDLLVDSEGESISGKLTTITGEPSGKRSVGIKTKHNPAELSVPDHRVSFISFARPEENRTYPANSFIVEFGRKGSLQLENPKIMNGEIAFTHPILGPCKLASSHITRIKQRDPQPNQHQDQ